LTLSFFKLSHNLLLGGLADVGKTSLAQNLLCAQCGRAKPSASAPWPPR